MSCTFLHTHTVEYALRAPGISSAAKENRAPSLCPGGRLRAQTSSDKPLRGGGEPSSFSTGIRNKITTKGTGEKKKNSLFTPLDSTGKGR
ncbi:hypothetical protein TNIN_415891 [Trichonephila inaurata madagascariensis]|uniref:Uncharacterized protein n=1 Tax=Trichonephila inaurata madagascariensis TaxID=2747483 RepID=A0A8X7BVS0_9ARAC|nr:hypothetical protein TNIN_415891 [Trichonephila inaurata madagascariensis]